MKGKRGDDIWRGITCQRRDEKAEAETRGLFSGGKGKEILGAFDGFLEALEEELEVFAAFDEVDVGRIDDEEVGGGVTEKEMFVGVSDFLDVLGSDLRLVAGGLFGDAGAKNLGLGLKIDDEIGSGDTGGERFVIAIVKLQLFVIEIEIGEDAVLFEEEIGEDRAGRFNGERFANALLALDEEIHLGAEGGAGLFLVKIAEKGIVLAIVDAAGVKTFGEDFGESRLANAKRAFNDDEAGRLWPTLGARSAFGCGRFVGRHLRENPRAPGVAGRMNGIIAESIAQERR